MAWSFDGYRRVTQLASLLVSHSYLQVFSTRQIYKGPLKGTCLPVLACQSCPSAIYSCPIGALQHFVVVGQFPFFLFGLVGFVGLLVGRMACGWLCPFGLIQDLLHRLDTTKLALAKELHLLRYPVLLFLVLLLPFVTGESWFSVFCPAGTLTAAIPWAVWNPTDPVAHLPLIAAGSLGSLFLVKVAILAGFLGLFVVAKRPFCRIACPLGLLLSLFNRTSVVRLEVSGQCTGCGACQRSCPVDRRVHEDPNGGDCIRCLSCTKCPEVKLVARPVLGAYDRGGSRTGPAAARGPARLQ
jgi:polyferredoxin